MEGFMTTKYVVVAVPLFLAIAALAGSPAAKAAIKLPSCPELSQLGQEIVPNQVVPINETPSRFTVYAAYMTPKFEALFGAPALNWSVQDADAAIKLAVDCANEAKKARSKPDIAAHTAAWRGFGALKSTLGAIAATEPKLDAGLKYLLDDPQSRLTLDVMIIVASVRDGSAEAMQKTAKDLKDSTFRHNVSSSVHSHGQNLLKVLSDAPHASWARVFPPLDQRIAEMRQWAIEDAKAQFGAIPESVQGLQKLEPLLKKAKAELSFALGEAELASLDQTAADRRNAIEDSMLAQEVAAIEAAPENVAGLNQLRAAEQSPVKAVLSAPRAATLNEKIAARRQTIGSVVTDEQIKQLEQFPEDMAGLRDLHGFKTGTANGLQILVDSAAAAKFSEAASTRADKIGEAAFGPFQKALYDIPATEEGLAELDNALREIEEPIRGLSKPVQARYVEAAVKSREKIIAAVQKEDERLAKLPLKEGAVFVDREVGAKLEFRDKNRVYMTVFNQTMEAEYEVDGDRVVIRQPTGNHVFTREGPYIRGMDLNFKRQAAN
jgi:hypothetical protein